MPSPLSIQLEAPTQSCVLVKLSLEPLIDQRTDMGGGRNATGS
jgi:hypothetical protein